eukprot:2774350-Rhodomonas_salina.2
MVLRYRSMPAAASSVPHLRTTNHHGTKKPTVLRMCCAMCGTEVGYGARHVLRDVRCADNATGSLVLTCAYHATRANDYVTKPFSKHELVLAPTSLRPCYQMSGTDLGGTTCCEMRGTNIGWRGPS